MFTVGDRVNIKGYVTLPGEVIEIRIEPSVMYRVRIDEWDSLAPYSWFFANELEHAS